MTSIIKVTCISGALDHSPPCYLLQIDQFRCLLDCGWDENFTMSIVQEMERHVNSLDAVLLSHPDPLHLGALPYLVGKCGLSCPIYSTRPVTLMGRMFMTDLLKSRLNGEDFTLFNQDDVNKAFEKIHHLSYNQSLQLSGNGHGLSITPLQAGHMVGSAIWKIVKDNDEDIIYAVDYNHKKEQHLNGCVLDTLSRPSLLITDAYNALNHQVRMKERDQQLMNCIIDTLRGGGNVLIACDTAGRVLELSYMLDYVWRKQESGLSAYSLALVSNVASNMIEVAKSTIEWMSEKIQRMFEDRRDNPFQFKHLQLKHKLSELSKLPQPMAVLASQPDFESGFARDLFTLWSTDCRNCIILTQRSSFGTLAHEVLNSPKRFIRLEIRQRIELEGDELRQYLEKENIKKQQALAEKKETQESDSESSDEDQDVEMGVGSRKASKALVPMPPGVPGVSTQLSSSHDILMKEGRPKGVTFFKQARKTHPMFPAPVEQRLKWDDYGEIINPEDYIQYNPAMDTFNEIRRRELEDDKENKDEEIEGELAEPEKPSRCVSIEQDLHIQARIEFFDFEGRSDGESVKNIIKEIKPRRLILVRGTQEASHQLATNCQSSVSDKIFIPKTGDIVDATTENHIYQVKLTDNLVTALNFARSEDGTELAWVEGLIESAKERSLLPAIETAGAESTDPDHKPATLPKPTDTIVRNPPVDSANKNSCTADDLLPSLEALQLDQATIHKTLFVNELKLSDFKQVLMNHGIQAEFSGGVLYCNDRIAVRRREQGRIHLEGTVGPDYYKVRKLLYDQYVII